MLEDGILEFKCRSSRCGAGRGKVIIHRFSATSGDLLETKVFKDPTDRKVGEQDGSAGSCSALWSA